MISSHLIVYNNYTRKDIVLYAEYGHSTISVSPSFSIPGGGSLTITPGSVKVISRQWNDRKCS